MLFYFQASEQDVEMILRFGGGKLPEAKTKTPEKLPGLISTLMEEEKVIKEKYEMLNLTESVLTLAENVSNVKCDESGTAVRMEEVIVETKDSVGVIDEIDEVSKDHSENEMKEGPNEDSAMETKIQELYSLILKTGDEGRIENFQKFVLNKQSC